MTSSGPPSLDTETLLALAVAALSEVWAWPTATNWAAWVRPPVML